MNYNKVNIIYFSATGTTAMVAKVVGEGMGGLSVEYYDITQGMTDLVQCSVNEVAIFAVPVYSGRVPQIAIKALNQFVGDNTPAILTCVYGNRDFDDALVELKDIVEKNGFKAIAAGAFIAEHSIFPQVAHNRPDELDLGLARSFGHKCSDFLIAADSLVWGELVVKGNRPYRAISSIPLSPKTNKNCNACGICAKQCPTSAIDKENPRITDKKKCISCAHCIAVCPKKARHFGGIVYKIASKKFTKKCALRHEPYVVTL